MDAGEGRRQHRFQPDGAVGGIGEGQALGVDVLRIVRGDDDVDRAVGQRLDHRHAVVLGAQRRRQLEEGAVFADVVLVQRQMVDRDAAGDVGAARLRAPGSPRPNAARDLGGVVAARRSARRGAGRARAG